MSLFITVLGLLGLAGGAASMHHKGVKAQANKIKNNPAHAIPNIYSPGYNQFRNEYECWEQKKKIYDAYCDEERKIWADKLNEMIDYCGSKEVTEESFQKFKVCLKCLDPTYIGNPMSHIEIRISTRISDTIPMTELDWSRNINGKLGFKRLGFHNISVYYNGEEALYSKGILIMDRHGDYSKSLEDFEREAYIETIKLRQYYESVGFVFPKFPEEYSYFEKWVNPVNTDYTRFNR